MSNFCYYIFYFLFNFKSKSKNYYLFIKEGNMCTGYIIFINIK